MAIQPKPFFVNLEPITVLGIRAVEQMFCIYTGKKGKLLQFEAIAEKAGGTALGTIFKKSEHKWIGKVGMPTGILRNDPLTIRRRTRKEINLDTIREKLAYDLYQELGRGLFSVPKTRLSQQRIMDQFTTTHFLAMEWVSQGIQDSLRIMSRFVEGYQDFEKAKTEDGGEAIAFMEYIKRHHRPPETLLTPEGRSVPLKGVMSLLTVGRCLADTDVLGGSGGNAGFIWKEDAQGIQSAQAVKIDPGESFKFIRNPKLEKVSINWVINTKEKVGHPDSHLQDLRDLQTSNSNTETLIVWSELAASQQEEFLATLFNSSRYLQSKEVLHFLFYREGAFNRSETECISEKIALDFQSEMEEWMRLQLKIYANDLKEFKQSHPEQLIRVHYIDKWGELSLPMTEETFPIRELFTHLRIAKEEKVDPDKENPSMGSWLSLGPKVSFLKLEELFHPNQTTEKILFTGQAGTGKSTICQKIAHDWASGRLWNDQFDAVYWLPLRQLNSKELSADDLDLFLASTLSALIFQEELIPVQALDLIKNNRSKSLILLDGYDEASASLKKVIAGLIQEKGYKIFLTSRPGTTDDLNPHFTLRVENMGFSDDHIEEYAKLFFSLGKENKHPLPFLQLMRKNKNLFDLAHIPLQLQMLCSLWKQKSEGFASNLTGLYKQMVDQLLLWNSRKFKLSSPQEILLLLGQIAHRSLSTNQLILSKQELEKSLKNTAYTKEDLLATGLLKELEEGNSSAFLHLGFQEYLIACAFANRPLEQQREFILAHRDNPQYHQTLTFLCGIIFQSTLQEIPSFFEALYESTTTSSAKERLRLGFQCLNETSNLQTLPAFDSYLAKNLLLMLEEDSSFYQQTNALKYLYTKHPELLGMEVDELGSTPFILICYMGNLDLAKWLCEKNPSLIGKFTKDGRTPLHEAAREGHVEMARWLCEKDLSLLEKFDSGGWTPLHSAAQQGHMEMAKWLCEKDPSLLGKFTNDGWTPLHAAAREGHVEMARWLCEKDLSLLEKFDSCGWTPLHLAAEGGHVGMAKWLCKKDPSLLGKFKNDGLTPLHLAAQQGHMEMVKWLCEKDPSLIGKFKNNGTTPLHAAAYGGHVEMARWLYKKDPSLIGKFNNNGTTPLHLAAQQDHVEMARWLCEKDPTLLGKFRDTGATPLHSAAVEGHMDTVKWLSEKDPSLLRKLMSDGRTPLHWAALRGDVEMAKWLCEKDPSLIQKFRNDDTTPLHWAALRGHVEMARWLCEKDPSLIGKFTKNGGTPLHSAAKEGHVQMAKWLCEKDPSLIGKFTKNGGTPLHSAAKEGHVQMAKWLCEKDPSLIGKFTKNGGTPLHSAAKEGHVQMAKWLCEKDPSLIGKFTKNGGTPLHAAAQQGHMEMAKWLYEKDPSLLEKFGNNGTTPLYSAVQRGHMKMAKWLCEKDPSLLGKFTNDGWTPLHLAADGGHVGMAKWLCEKDPSLIGKFTNDGWTPLHLAADGGHVGMAEWLCKKDPSLLGKFKNDGLTPLHLAAQQGHMEMAKWLCEKDPSLMGKFTNDGETPLHLAAEKGHMEMVQWLYFKNPKQCLVKWFGDTPYRRAVKFSHTEVANWLKVEEHKQEAKEKCVLS